MAGRGCCASAESIVLSRKAWASGFYGTSDVSLCGRLHAVQIHTDDDPIDKRSSSPDLVDRARSRIQKADFPLHPCTSSSSLTLAASDTASNSHDFAAVIGVIGIVQQVLSVTLPRVELVSIGLQRQLVFRQGQYLKHTYRQETLHTLLASIELRVTTDYPASRSEDS